MATLNGHVRVVRRCWWAKGEGGDSPVDRLLDLARSTVSVGVRELSCQMGIDCRGFARLARNLLSAAQLSLSKEKLRQIVEGDGKAVLAAQQNEQLEIDWSASDCKTTTPEGKTVSRIYVSADGVKVPVTTTAEKQKRRQTVLRKRRENRPGRGVRRRRLGAVKPGADQRYKQFNLTSFYDQEQTRRLVSVTRLDHRASARLLRRDAARLRIKAADERVGLVDGAPCLRNQMDKLPLTALGLDFYHLSEHVHEAKRSTFPEKSAEAKPWADDLMHTVRHEGYQPFWQKLTDFKSKQRGKAKRQAADDLLHYVSQRREMINYPLFEQRGWQIGTGPIESMCGTTTLRVKGKGMRWDQDNAEAMMALEALYQSNQWESYWKKAAIRTG